MKPTDVIAYRNMLLEREIRGPRPGEAWVTDRWLINNLRTKNCGLYYVAPDMTALAKAAGQSLPLAEIGLSVLPSSTGFMLFDGAVIGTTRDDDSIRDVVGVWWHESLPGDHGSPPQVMICPLVREGPMIVSAAGNLYWDQNEPDLGHTEEDEAYLEDCVGSTAIASWLLMGQTITWVEREAPDRHERRRCARAGLRPSDIVVVRLRKVERRRDENGDLVSWTHRWLVNGHWRQQWYPGSQEHRPIWISPHVKGPADKPFIAKEQVTAWIR